MTRILKTLFGIFALIVFAASMLVMGPAYFIVFTFAGKKKAPFIAHKYVSRAWAKTLFPLFGIRVKVENKHFLDKGQTYVFIANHRSQLDIPAYALATDHTFRFLAKAELMKIPVMGYVIRKLYISVDRKDKAARARSMENMKRSLAEGISIFICPEGTRNKTSEPLLEFHDGAFRIAIESKKPLAVMAILNSEKLLSPLRPIELSPGTLKCKWAEPIETSSMTLQDLPALKEKARRIMLGLLHENSPT